MNRVLNIEINTECKSQGRGRGGGGYSGMTEVLIGFLRGVKISSLVFFGGFQKQITVILEKLDSIFRVQKQNN